MVNMRGIATVSSRVRRWRGIPENIRGTLPGIGTGIMRGSPDLLKIGMGYDIHRLVPGRKLVIGGVDIPFFQGLWGHSDADVLVHAVIDAILGAFSLGDIGAHFPDSDPQYKDAVSTDLLGRVREKAAPLGAIQNVDATIVAQRPRMAPYIEAMRKQIADSLRLPVERISIKAKTAEGVGPIGEGAAIEAFAVALVDATNG